jgi:hypothetical protein
MNLGEIWWERGGNLAVLGLGSHRPNHVGRGFVGKSLHEARAKSRREGIRRQNPQRAPVLSKFLSWAKSRREHVLGPNHVGGDSWAKISTRRRPNHDGRGFVGQISSALPCYRNFCGGPNHAGSTCSGQTTSGGGNSSRAPARPIY